jgi:hypothetical protein
LAAVIIELKELLLKVPSVSKQTSNAISLYLKDIAHLHITWKIAVSVDMPALKAYWFW